MLAGEREHAPTVPLADIEQRLRDRESRESDPGRGAGEANNQPPSQPGSGDGPSSTSTLAGSEDEPWLYSLGVRRVRGGTEISIRADDAFWAWQGRGWGWGTPTATTGPPGFGGSEAPHTGGRPGSSAVGSPAPESSGTSGGPEQPATSERTGPHLGGGTATGWDHLWPGNLFGGGGPGGSGRRGNVSPISVLTASTLALTIAAIHLNTLGPAAAFPMTTHYPVFRGSVLSAISTVVIPLAAGRVPEGTGHHPLGREKNAGPQTWKDALAIESEDDDLVPLSVLKKAQRKQDDELNRSERASTTISGDLLLFEGYDCSRPFDITALTMNQDEVEDCDVKETPKPREQQFTLLQKVQRTRFYVKWCQIKRTKIVHHCGGSSHSALAPGEWRVEEFVPVSTGDCKDAWESATLDGRAAIPYRADNTASYNVPIHLNATINHPIQVTGKIWAENNDVNCIGGNYYFTEYTDRVAFTGHMVQTDLLKIETKVMEATIDQEGVVVIHQSQLRLPCNGKREKGCVVKGEGTFIWTTPSDEEACPYYKTRETHGWVMDDDKGEQVYVSNEESMIRVRPRPAVGACGGVVFPTEYHNIYLADKTVGRVPAFDRPLHESEMSMALYVNQQDSFLYHRLLHKIKEALTIDHGQRCKARKWRKENAYALKAAEQHAIRDGETVRIGRNQFVTAAGNIWYHYRCRRREVRARSIKGCYAALPVSMTVEDFRTYRRERTPITPLTSDPENGRTIEPLEDYSSVPPENPVFSAINNEFFLEPKSKRIVTVAIPSTCGTPLAPRYQNTQGLWISYNEKVFSIAPDPIQMEKVQWELPWEQEEELDFQEGGVYTPGQIRRMDQYVQNPRIVDGFPRSVGQGLTEQPPAIDPNDDKIGSSWFVPELPDLNILQGFTSLNWLWEALQTYGHICSIVVASIFFGRVITWIGGVILRLMSIPLSGNLCVHIASAFCPSFREFLAAPGAFFLSCVNILRGPNWPPPSASAETRHGLDSSYIPAEQPTPEPDTRRRRRVISRQPSSTRPGEDIEMTETKERQEERERSRERYPPRGSDDCIETLDAEEIIRITTPTAARKGGRFPTWRRFRHLRRLDPLQLPGATDAATSPQSPPPPFPGDVTSRSRHGSPGDSPPALMPRIFNPFSLTRSWRRHPQPQPRVTQDVRTDFSDTRTTVQPTGGLGPSEAVLAATAAAAATSVITQGAAAASAPAPEAAAAEGGQPRSDAPPRATTGDPNGGEPPYSNTPATAPQASAP